MREIRGAIEARRFEAYAARVPCLEDRPKRALSLGLGCCILRGFVSRRPLQRTSVTLWISSLIQHMRRPPERRGGQSMLSAMLLPVLLLVVFYFLLIRPQNKRAKEQREMLSKVAVGDEVATTGGILGKVTEVGEQFLTPGNRAAASTSSCRNFKSRRYCRRARSRAHDRLSALEDRAGRDRPADRDPAGAAESVRRGKRAAAGARSRGRDRRRPHGRRASCSRTRASRRAARFWNRGALTLRFSSKQDQLKARDLIAEARPNQFTIALSQASRVPEWMRNLGLSPLKLGLDLRGGVYLVYQVDVQGAVKQLLDRHEQDFRASLRNAHVALSGRRRRLPGVSRAGPVPRRRQFRRRARRRSSPTAAI